MARRPVVASEPKRYKYDSLIQCEEAGNHRFTARAWPPPRMGQVTGDPSIAGVCDLCGCNLIVYEMHAKNPDLGIDVIVPKEKAG